LSAFAACRVMHLARTVVESSVAVEIVCHLITSCIYIFLKKSLLSDGFCCCFYIWADFAGRMLRPGTHSTPLGLPNTGGFTVALCVCHICVVLCCIILWGVGRSHPQNTGCQIICLRILYRRKRHRYRGEGGALICNRCGSSSLCFSSTGSYLCLIYIRKSELKSLSFWVFGVICQLF